MRWLRILLAVALLFCCILALDLPVSAQPVLLQLGAQGEIVKVLQELLTAQGLYKNEIDGTFGSGTKDAVRLFQARAGLAVDAVVGPDTWEAITEKPYLVCAGDTFANLDERFGLEAGAWQEANPHLEPGALKSGIRLKVPELPLRMPKQLSRGGIRIPVGQLREWSKVNEQFIVNWSAKIIDVDTGFSFTVRRRGGYNHADVEPQTAADTNILRQLYPSWSWRQRAVVVDYGQGPVAASINGYPHGGYEVLGNNFPGHICLHFLGSRTHGDQSYICSAHQAMVKKAAGF